MTRQLAADDYEAIRKRMEELRPQPQPASPPRVDDFMTGDWTGLPPYTPNIEFTPKESKLVAERFNCTWRGAASQGCGKNVSRDCLKHGKCMHNT